MASLLFLSWLTAGCAIQSTIDRLEPKIGSPTEANNLVAKSGTKERPEFTTGGFLAGTKPYAVASWKEIASTQFPKGKFTLLAGDEERVRLGKVFAVDASGESEQWKTILAARFAAMADILGGQMPAVDIRYHLVPSGVKYRLLAKQPFNGFEAISLDLLAVIPPSGQLDRDWLLTQAITAVHESFHIVRKDPSRFPRHIAMEEEEIEAYLAGMCSSVIASNRLPETLFAFPKGLEEAVDPAERDILIRDVYEQTVEQKEEPTVVGLNVAMLAFFRYLTALKGAGLDSPGARESVPFCKAAARDELHWAQADIDLQIKHLADQTAKLASISRSVPDQRKQ